MAVQNVEPDKLKSAVVEPNKLNKKKKFSSFRIFTKSHDETSSKCGKKKPNRALKSSGFVNCITSSGTSESSSPTSSCEKLKTTTSQNKLLKEISKLTKRQNDKNSSKNGVESAPAAVLVKSSSQTQTKGESAKVLENNTLTKSVTGSLNSKITNGLDYEEDDYNEIQHLELCPMAADDADIDYADECHSRSNYSRYSTPHIECGSSALPSNVATKASPVKNVVYNNFHIYNNSANVVNMAKSYANDVISVPLNNYLYYNYEKKDDLIQKNKV